MAKFHSNLQESFPPSELDFPGQMQRQGDPFTPGTREKAPLTPNTPKLLLGSGTEDGGVGVWDNPMTISGLGLEFP